MTLVVPNVGEQKFLRYGLNVGVAEDQIIKLFQNNYTPTETDTVASFTEANFTGYAQVSLPGSGWSIVSSGVTTATHSTTASFVSSVDQTAQNIYGYYVIGASTGVLLWAERFTGAPFIIAANGDTINVTPKITAD